MMGNCPMIESMMGMMNGGMGIWMFAFWILVIAGIALLAVWGVQRVRRSEHNVFGESALDTLKKRYAHGKINKEEYEEKRRDISIQPSS